jgi:hypothetical protein
LVYLSSKWWVNPSLSTISAHIHTFLTSPYLQLLGVSIKTVCLRTKSRVSPLNSDQNGFS